MVGFPKAIVASDFGPAHRRAVGIPVLTIVVSDRDAGCDRVGIGGHRFIGIDWSLVGSNRIVVGADIGKNSEAEGKCGGEGEN